MTARRVHDLAPGDLVDAETFGDYLSEGDAIVAEYEYWTVADVCPETPECTRVDFDNADSYGLPPDLIVQVHDVDAPIGGAS